MSGQGLRNWLQRLRGPRVSRRKPEGEAGIRALGHRKYVGGRWDEIGRLQFDFLRSRGLQSHHVLLDIACGSLRGGVHFIPWLQPGHYLGMDKEGELLRLGVEEELGQSQFEAFRPHLLVSSDFEFERFEKRADFALAQSLFSHLPPALIRDCLAKLHRGLTPEGVFFATFFESRAAVRREDTAHDHGDFFYTRGRWRRWRPRRDGLPSTSETGVIRADSA